jgi:arylformamidase
MSTPAEAHAPDHDDWIDVTVPIRRGMVRWPDNPEVGVLCDERVVDKGGGICRVTSLTLGAHTGTHVDAPNHFGVSPHGVDTLPVATFIGPARVVAVAHRKHVHRDELASLKLSPGERVLLKTRNSERAWGAGPFNPDFVYVTPEAARWFVERKVRMVGVDYLSVGGMEDGHVTHRILLEGGVSILEGLDLSKVAPGHYDLIALPLRIEGADGAPARAVLRPRKRR